MFQDAALLARKFTLPVITSIKSVGGTVASGTGTFVVVNDEGWIVTAAHIFKNLKEIADAQARTRAIQAQSQSLSQTANRKQRRAAAAQSHGPKATDIDEWSTWWGFDGAKLDDSSVVMIETADIAVARFQSPPPFVTTFPKFKDPDKGIEPGASLCRLGFPFYKLVTTHDAATGFRIHNLPLPIFLNEGVLSRMFETILIDPTGNALPPPPFPLKAIETSSPGIRGQSGGPIFDRQGTIWAIQSATTSYELDYNIKEKQYYHVGVGVHVATILGLFQQLKIKHDVSAY